MDRTASDRSWAYRSFLQEESVLASAIPGLPDDVAAAKAQRDEAWKRWHEQCMAWFEVYEEVHGEPVPNA